MLEFLQKGYGYPILCGKIVQNGYKSEVSGREQCQNPISRLLDTQRVQQVKNMLRQLDLFILNKIIISKAMTQNIIQIKSIPKHQVLSLKPYTPSQLPHKQNTFPCLLDYLQPKNYPFFRKQYCSLKSGIDSQILYDMREYTQLLSNQKERMIYQINGLLNEQFLRPLFKILEFYSQLTQQASMTIQKMSKTYSKIWAQVKKIPEKNEEQLNRIILCHSCKAEIVKNQIQKLKNELQVRDFEDKYDYYKIDSIKLFQMKKLRNYSDQLFKSELEDERRDILIAEKAISLQEFEEILNLFGSDIHKKNNLFQSGIHQINELCKVVNEENHNYSVEDKQLKQFEFFIGNKQINKKLKAIFKKFYNKYNKIKAEKRRDRQSQTNFKESQDISQLQKVMKELKLKLYRVEAQKIKQNQQNTKIIKELNIKNIALMQQNEQFVSLAQSKYLQYQKRREELKNQVQMLKKQLLMQNKKYQNLQNEHRVSFRGQRRQTKNSRMQRTHSKRNTDLNIKNQAMSPRLSKKKRNQVVQQTGKSSNQDIVNNETSDNTIKSQKKLLNYFINKASRNTSIMSKKSLIGETNEIQLEKHTKNESIKQKRQQEQSDDMKGSKSNKISRFRGLPKFIHQNQNISAKIFGNKNVQNQKNQKDMQVMNKERIVRSQETQSVSSVQYQHSLKMLYDFQTKRVSLLSMNFDDFAVNYQRFIKEISSQKEAHTLGQRQGIVKGEAKEKKQSIPPTLAKSHSFKGNSTKISPQRQHNKQNNQNKKSLKLEHLKRKSTYFMRQHTKNFSTYETKGAASAVTSLESSKVFIKEPIQMQRRQICQQVKKGLAERINEEKILQSSQIVDFFGGKQNIDKFYTLLQKNEEFVLDLQETQLIMSGMTLLAQLHLVNPYSYQYLKKIIVSPRLWTEPDFYNNTSTENNLQNALKAFIVLHRCCAEKTTDDKNRYCKHFQMLKQLIISFLQKYPQSLQVKQQKIKKSTEKKQNRRNSSKQFLKNL